MRELPKLKSGKRLFLTGTTGSGKSEFLRHFIRGSKQHVIILDTKGEFGDMAKTSTDPMESIALMQKYSRVAYIPPLGLNDPRSIDDFIGRLHLHYKNVCLAIDEGYAAHSQGRCGDGLVAWVTRGRSLKQTLILASQRPAWISLMLISEADIIGAGRLKLPSDKKRLTDATGSDSFNTAPQDMHTFRFYEASSGDTGLFKLDL